VGTSGQEVRRGTGVSRPAGTGIAHTFRAGDDGLTLLRPDLLPEAIVSRTSAPVGVAFAPTNPTLPVRAKPEIALLLSAEGLW